MRLWLLTLAALAGCDSIFNINTVRAPADAADAMIDAPILQGWKATAAGWFHSCGIRADDTLWCWGSNEVGELGLGVTSGLVDKPMRVSTDGFSEVSSTYEHTCALGLDGAIRCWGDNAYGQLGAGNLAEGGTPRVIPGPWKHVSAGALTTCAIRGDDTLWCWGWNPYGQVGIGTTMQTPVPAQVGTETWLDVDAGWYHTCGIKTDHTMWCWGYEAYGEFGNGDDGAANLSYVPKPGPPGSWNIVQAGAWTTCGITSDSQLRCWGLDEYGELGDGAQAPSHVPKPVLIDGKDVTDWLSVTIDHTSTCGIRQDASMWCWGNDRMSQLGVDIGGAGFELTPTHTVQVSPQWRRVDMGVAHSCAITSENELFCVGGTARGELGNGATNHPTPHAMPLSGLSLALAASATCGLDSDGTIHCAGYNGYGELGDQSTRSHDMMTTMAPPLQGVLVVAPGYGHTCASTATATYCWGGNAQAQLGNNSTTESYVPVVATGAPAFGALSAYNHTCGIDKTGSGGIYCWGDNDFGQVGDGTYVDRTTAVGVGGNGAQIAVSPYHTCTLTTGGAIYCWGRGSEGQLGLGDFATHPSAQPVPTDVTGACNAVAVGWYHTCAISTTGVLYCWGGNQYGQLGQGDGIYRGTAIAVGTATWKSVAAGTGHTCGVRTDGTLWCWGRNTHGQLGLGNYDARYVPGEVGTDTDWAKVYAGDEHTCGVKATGQVLCWGANEDGETPDGTAWTATMVRVP